MTTSTNDDTGQAAGVIQMITCYAINCADCGDDCWNDGDGYTPHFDSKADLRKQLVQDYRWTHDRHGRWLCDDCTRQADCTRHGHRWGHWRPTPTDIEVAWRSCTRCGHMEDLLAALLPDRSAMVATATNTGKGHSPAGRVLSVLRDPSQTGQLTAADVAALAGLDHDLAAEQLLRLRALGVVWYDFHTWSWRAA